MPTNKKNTENRHIPIGSAYIYAMEYTGTIPDDAVIETPENEVGYVSEGATIEYTAEKTIIKDDFGRDSRTVTTEETATLTANLLSWSSKKFEYFNNTARVDDSKEGRRTVKLGGAANENGKSYLWRVVHPDKKFGTVRVTMCGVNSGLTLTFKKDEGGQLPISVSGEAIDSEGTLLIYDEEVPTEEVEQE